MHKAMVAILVAGVALPFASHAADLSNDNVQYNFIQDNTPAQPAVVGHLSLGVGYVNQDMGESFEAPDEKYGIFNGAGRVNVDFGWLNVELETGGQAAFNDSSSLSSIGATGHLWGRANNFAIGVYGGVDFPTGLTIYTVGGEAEAYLGAVTLGANIDYNWTDTSGCCGVGDFWTTRGWADFYVTPNARVGAELSYAARDDFLGPGVSLDNWSAVADAEYRFAGTPVSAWIEGRYDHPDPSPCLGDCENHTWSGMIGLRIFMDGAGTTLHEHDRLVPWEREYPVDWRTVPVCLSGCIF